jgi:hypothetical protein
MPSEGRGREFESRRVRHSSCLEIKRVFAKFQALGAARTKRRESGQISRESAALPEIPSKPGQIFERSSRAFPAMALRLFPLGTRRNNAFWLSCRGADRRDRADARSRYRGPRLVAQLRSYATLLMRP